MKRRPLLALLAASIRHGLQDAALSVIPILLAARSGELHLSNAQIGLGFLLYQTMSSISQPFFGHLSDRRGLPWLPTVAVMWTSLMIGVAGLGQSYVLTIVPIALAGLGSGAFHPQSAAGATAAGGSDLQATAASVFFLGGSLGQALLGSALAGVIISLLGPRALLLLTALIWAVDLVLYRWMRVGTVIGKPQPRLRGTGRDSIRTISWFGLAMFLLAIAVRALNRQGFVNFVPKLYQDWGYSPAVYGPMLSLYFFSNALGGVAGCYLADRWGTKRVLAISLLVATPLLVGFLYAGGTSAYVTITLAGLLSGPSHTLLVVAGQRLLPKRAALASGLVLGFTFVSGSVLTWATGFAADQLGLYPVLQVVAALSAVAALLGYLALSSLERRTRAASASHRRVGIEGR